jgi:Protein of unknown function (DUF1524)
VNRRTVLLAFAAVAAVVLLLPQTGRLTTNPAPQPTPGPTQPLQAPPGPLHADRATEALARLQTAPAGPLDGYERDAFGYDWLDLDSDGCNTREEVLARDMRSETRPDGCNVETGILVDPYTTRRIEFVEDVNASAVQVDHVVALGRAWQMGADTWTDDKRERFANDPLNLVATDGPTNASKGADGPATWRPPAPSGWCLYAVRYVRVSAAYDLPVTGADKAALTEMLGSCP